MFDNPIYGPWRTYSSDHPTVSHATLGDVFDYAADVVERQGFHPNSTRCYDKLYPNNIDGPLCATAAIYRAVAELAYPPGTANAAIGWLERCTGSFVANRWSDGQTAESVVATFRVMAGNFNS